MCEYFQRFSAEDNLINTCLEFWQGICHEPMSPFDGEVCPWEGNYCNNPDRALVERVNEMDREVEG